MRKGKLFWLFVAVAAFTIGEAAAQERDRFGLFTDCGPVDVSIEPLDAGDKEVGLKESRLETLIEAASTWRANTYRR